MGLPRKLLHGRTNLDFRKNRWLIGLLGCALAIRVVLALGVQYQLDHRWQRDFVIEGDANGYWELAQTIISGDDYAIYSPPRYVLRMPGYPAFLVTSMFLFGESHLAARILSAIVGTLGCGLVYLLSKCFFDETTSIIAAGWAAFSPTLAGFSVILLSETLFAVTLLLSLIAFAKLNGMKAKPSGEGEQEPQRSSPILWSVLTGFAIAAACYVRPSWILVAPVFAVVYVVLNRKRILAASMPALIIIASLGIALLPWAIRNDQVTGHFVLTTLWMGPSLYDGLNPDLRPAIATWTFYENDQFHASRRLVRARSECRTIGTRHCSSPTLIRDVHSATRVLEAIALLEPASQCCTVPARGPDLSVAGSADFTAVRCFNLRHLATSDGILLSYSRSSFRYYILRAFTVFL